MRESLNVWKVACAVLVAISLRASHAHHSLALYFRETTEMEGKIVSVEMRTVPKNNGRWRLPRFIALNAEA
jgi:hypothetical protein